MTIVYCCDVGSVKTGAFGWVRATRTGPDLKICGNDQVDDLVYLLKRDLEPGGPIALGFEAPLFVPVPQTSQGLSCGRDGERDRSCFAPAGGYVATLGMHELLFVLAQLGPLSAKFTLDWNGWVTAQRGEVLLWEAFVSGTAHSPTGNHCQDAATAAVAFLDALTDGFETVVEIKAPRKTFSFAGAALLWAGTSRSLELLHQSTLVVKPRLPFAGEIQLAVRG